MWTTGRSRYTEDEVKGCGVSVLTKVIMPPLGLDHDIAQRFLSAMAISIKQMLLY
jgi:hypothetical protein